MLFALQLLAQQADQTQQSTGGNGASLLPLLAMGVVFVLFYFLMIRGPMKRQEQERQALLAAVKKNDRVITSGGLIGTVMDVKEDEVVLKVDENSNVRVRVTKASIVRNLSGEKAAREQKEAKA